MYVTVIVQSILPFAFRITWMGIFLCHVIEITAISHATSQYSEDT